MLPAPVDSSVLWLVLCWLAVWRLAALACYDEGPFAVLTRLRKGLARIGLGRVIACFHCTALWISIIVIAAVFDWSWLSPVIMLATAGAASITERWLGGAAPSAPEEDRHE